MMRRTDLASAPGPQGGQADDLLQLSPAGSGLSPKLLSAPGGFLWWYADLVAPNGDGLVVIWSYGLPFLPGYASAARRQQAPPAGQRPSLNISTYKKGVLDFYLLQEFSPDQVQWDPLDHGDRWSFGPSQITSRCRDGQRHLELALRPEIPGIKGPTEISLSAQGPGCIDGDKSHDPGQRRQQSLPDHDWVPLLAGLEARADLKLNGTDLQISGRLYHDRNGGKTPLHDLGLQSWVWGRLPLADGEFIYYVLDGKDGQTQSLLLRIDDQGQIRPVEDASFHRLEKRKNLGGLTWWPQMAVERRGQRWLTIDHGDVVDSGPFYMRTIPTATDARGQSVRGIAEFCEPDRIDMAHHRPLVRMRVHHQQGANSAFLPLFTGPKKGRINRLVRSWLRQVGGSS